MLSRRTGLCLPCVYFVFYPALHGEDYGEDCVENLLKIPSGIPKIIYLREDIKNPKSVCAVWDGNVCKFNPTVQI